MTLTYQEFRSNIEYNMMTMIYQKLKIGFGVQHDDTYF
jgi:hypothetical protein